MDMAGKKKLLATIREVEEIANNNSCEMSDVAMGAIALGIDWVVKHISMPNEFSLEETARMLGVSVRQLRRIMPKAGVTPRRRGFKHTYLLQRDIDKLMSFHRDN